MSPHKKAARVRTSQLRKCSRLSEESWAKATVSTGASSERGAPQSLSTEGRARGEEGSDDEALSELEESDESPEEESDTELTLDEGDEAEEGDSG